ncbi:branched-chain amino acid ABC transporter substrate-binding protein [Bradyrhizobium sp. Arg62]|uniref:branched-chain amino acid ABC transporter substrate-binding protein n=1 Tax=Bradyrhizobium TaxID=374 RepID=UPI001E409088|nr:MULTISPECIES: branched-chain amino acid ABC transporter substrate-binding protein [Bradyrhizobium]MCC8942546.1 branched-chain amino acid ABC transporter substrate-binding protein [Bradyrhizobium ivorense]MCC8951274.1 branched-chain amino acid ABC transporter substrate-binding protein [Bradyrhizobium brasilense]
MLTGRYASAASAALLFCALASAARTSEVNIAVAAPMSGSNAAFGAQMRDGAAAAVEALNASGLLPDTKVIFSVADDACDPKQAVAVANKLTIDRVRLVVGHYCSSSSIPASDIYAEAGIVQMSPGSTNPQLTDRGLATVFRICGRDGQQGTVAAVYIHRNYHNDKIAVLDDKSTAGKGIADVVEAQLQRHGENVIRQSYAAGEKDYAALISRMKKDGVRVAYIGGYHTEIGLIVRQASEAGAGFTVMASDPLMTSEFWAITSSAGNGTLFTFMPDPAKNANAVGVVANLKASNVSAEGYTLYAYAAVQAWAEAVKRSGSFDAARVATALRSRPVDPVVGPVRFDTKGDNAAPGFLVYRWCDGRIEAVEQN